MLLDCATRHSSGKKQGTAALNNDLANVCTAGMPSSAVLFGPKTNHYTLEVAVRVKKVVKFDGSEDKTGVRDFNKMRCNTQTEVVPTIAQHWAKILG